MLCIRCHEKGNNVQMICVGETKPRITVEEQKIIQDIPFAKLSGKKKWKCPECGHTRTGNGNSAADLKEKLK